MTDRQFAETAADGLSVLANPLRLRILLALSETHQPDWEQRGMSYSDLRSAVDVEDGVRRLIVIVVSLYRCRPIRLRCQPVKLPKIITTITIIGRS
ncbi:hypothetical protein BRD19_05645 [Halobacteriales archaeon SW_7_65_23]|nr:MAG: hypothetical protein BRD19_05645 [Halobacteriales archaeon SW_7_65_23]